MIEIITDAPVAAPVETVTPISPIEALRLGRLIAPLKTHGSLFDGPTTACAIGAMALGYGWDRDKDDISPNDPADAYTFVEQRIAAYMGVEQVPAILRGHANEDTVIADIFSINDDCFAFDYDKFDGDGNHPTVMHCDPDPKVVRYLKRRGIR